MTIAILGGGQLARMLALAGLPLDLRCRCLDPAADAVAGHVAELIVGPYDEPSALQRLVRGADVVTFEFENVPVAATTWLERHLRVAPNSRSLAIGQDRFQEKTLFASLGFGVPGFRPADTLSELHDAIAAVGTPCIVKTRRLGYDGRGQVRIETGADLRAATAQAFATLATTTPAGLIVERMVPFDRELSVLGARGHDGSIAIYPLVENVHRNGILHRSRAPAPDLDPRLAAEATGFLRTLLEHLDYRGVLAVELFEIGGRLLANEMAPRVHNSGHWTIEGAVCSQFENHLRAVCGLPLGDTRMALGAHATMVNFIGALPARDQVLALPGVHLHAYGKAPRPGRKLGHATIVGADRAEVDALAAHVAALVPGHDGHNPAN